MGLQRTFAFALACKMQKSDYGSFERDENFITVQQAIEHVGFGKYQIQFYFVLVLVEVAEAMEVMLLSILSPALECEWGISSLQQALLTTVVFVGMVCTCSLWGHFTDRVGRKTGLMCAAAFMLIFGLLSAAAPSYGWFLAFRFLAGCGLGALTLPPALFSEYLPIRFRVQGMLALQMVWGVGSIFEVVLGLLVMESLGWRSFVALSALPLLLFLIMAPKFMDESARYLIVSGQSLKARRVLQKIADKNGTVLPEATFVDETCDIRGNIFELFSAEIRVTTILLFILWFIALFNYYGIVLFGTVLYASDDPCKGGLEHDLTSQNSTCGLIKSDYISLIWSAAAEIPGTATFLFLTNVIGRKKSTSGGMFLNGCTIAILFACLTNLPMTIIISVARGLGLGIANNLIAYTPEVYPTRIRAVATGTCSSIGRVGAAVAPFMAQVAASISLNIPIVIYSGLYFAGAVLTMFLPIETMGIDRG